MSKSVLILCTGNSCRSIIAEALINAELKGIHAYSSGVKASGRVNPNAKQLLEERGLWKDEYHSKKLDTMVERDYDLIVTVCGNAQETCPTFPKSIPTIHVGFDDPDGKEFEAFIITLEAIKKVLLPKIQHILTPMKVNTKENSMTKNVFKTGEGVKISFTGSVAKQNIVQMVENCATGSCECMSDETKAKITDMQVSGIDGDVALNLSGDLTKEEIEKALSRSKVINP